MKSLILTVFLMLLSAVPAFAENSVYFINVKSEYRNFAEIEPVLVNNLGRAIHLQFLYPNGAKLKRFNEDTGEWETGGKGIGCGTGAKPVEMAAGDNFSTRVDWEPATDDFEDPKFFELADHQTLRPLEGTYQIFMPYALEKWFFGTKPQKIYTVESIQFQINPEAQPSLK